MARYIDDICSVNVKVPAAGGGHPLAPPAPSGPDVLTTPTGDVLTTPTGDPLNDAE